MHGSSNLDYKLSYGGQLTKPRLHFSALEHPAFERVLCVRCGVV